MYATSRLLGVLTLFALVLSLPVLLATPASGADQDWQRVRIHDTTRDDNIRFLEQGYDLLATRPREWTDLYVPAEVAASLAASGQEVERLSDPPTRYPDYYTTYPEMLSQLQAWVTAYPEITLLEDIGDAWGKIYASFDYPAHDIWALKISDNAATDEAEPVILYTGVHHAREPASLSICMAIIEHLLTGYGSDPDITSWIDEHEIWVVPNVNPDGQWCCYSLDETMWRKNVRDNDGDGEITMPYWWYWPDGVDPNRNYAWEWGGEGASHDENSEVYCGPSAFSEPETQATRMLHERELPVFTFDFHSSGELVLYPYGYDETTVAPDAALLSQVAVAVANEIPRWSGGNYTPEQANDLYPAAGGSLDWEYGALNTFGYVIETCTDFYPGEAELNHAVAGNVQGAMVLQERVDGPGLRGTIRANGEPVEGTITILGLDNPPLNTPRRSHATLGDYYRLLMPGTYDVQFDVAGWDPILVEDVVIGSDTYTVLDADFGMSDVADDAAREAVVANGFAVYPTCVHAGARLTFRLPEGAETATLRVLDVSGRLVADLSASAQAAQGALSWSPHGGLTAGVYYAQLGGGSIEQARRFVVLPR